MSLNSDQAHLLAERFETTPTLEILQWAWSTFGNLTAIGTSFQGAGIVMMHLAKTGQIPIPSFTLDTDLLFPETIELKNRLEQFLEIKIEILHPEMSLQRQSEIKGDALWERDPDACCSLRKVEPLQRKLRQLDCWITGLRRQQSVTREQVRILELYEYDPIQNRTITKLNPMANWKKEEVWDYLKKHQIPYNPLHDRGYRSIGCMPCTQLNTSSEHERAGRWIGFNKTECGIHTFMKKKTN